MINMAMKQPTLNTIDTISQNHVSRLKDGHLLVFMSLAEYLGGGLMSVLSLLSNILGARVCGGGIKKPVLLGCGGFMC